MTPCPWFDIAVKPERDIVRIETIGELDLLSGGLLAAEVQELIAAGFDDIVIDLRRLGFIDLAGVRALFDLARAAEARACRLGFIRGGPPVRRLLEFARTLGSLPEAPS